MSTLVSIRINEEMLQTVKANAQNLHVSQTDYIRKAITLMNQKIEQQARAERLKAASRLVNQESMKVNDEFSEIEHDPED